MYFYIFDPGRDREIKYFERIQGRLSNLLSENRIEGETYRVTSIRTIELLIDQAMGAEAKTIIVVGSDGSLNRAINALVKKDSDITVGYIPLDPENSLGKILGISTDIEEAVKTLAGRLIANLDLGKVGEHYFLSHVDLGNNSFVETDSGFLGLSGYLAFRKYDPFKIELAMQDLYTATSEVMAAQIINCRNNEGCKQKLGDPTDKLLDILILPKLSSTQVFRYRRELATGCLDNVPGSTVMHAKKVDILGPRKLPISVEGQVYTKAPATVTVAKEKIKMIVGKSRQF
ncbi:MAG: diacylglycerol kinase family protein [bacterium]|nr:diacylglycerol kinase family protein [bacterium]